MADAATSSSSAIPSQDPIPTSRPPSPVQLGLQDAAHEPASPAPSLQSSRSWKSFRSNLSVSEKTSAQLGWAVAFLSVLFTVVALSPAFRSQTASEKALKLAEWTALKDYIEECREELAAGIQSQACLKAMKAKLPPPPYIKAGTLENARRGLFKPLQEMNATWRGGQVEYPETRLLPNINWILFVGFLLLGCIGLLMSFRNGHPLRRSYTLSPLDKEEEKFEPPEPPLTPTTHDTTTSSLRHPPPSPEITLRRRRDIRTHPIYRHANLEEAIHHEDLPEIRTRLLNGEDVNQHWPYLIYRLAITPPSIDTSKRLEIARLCLDFGADVNALKGWNGQSALVIAIHWGNVEVTKMLIANGAVVNNPTALHHCVRLAVTGSANDALEIMNMLFQHGADANQSDRFGESPLHKLLIDAWFSRHDDACMKKLYPVALCLVEHGAQMPETLKEKYILGNPLWDVVHTVIWQTEWPEQVGPDSTLTRIGRFLMTDKENEALMRAARKRKDGWEASMDIEGDANGNMTVQWPSAFQETGLGFGYFGRLTSKRVT